MKRPTTLDPSRRLSGRQCPKTCSEKLFLFSLLCYKVCKRLRNLQLLASGSRFFVFHAHFKVLSRLPSTRAEEEGGGGGGGGGVGAGRHQNLQGNTSLIETSSFVASCCFIDEGRWGGLIRAPACHLLGLYHHGASLHLHLHLHTQAAPCLVQQRAMLAFVWLTWPTKVTAAGGCVWTSGPAPLPLCTSVSAGAGQAGWKETNWRPKEGHSPSSDPPPMPRPLALIQVLGGTLKCCWLIPFSLPL